MTRPRKGRLSVLMDWLTMVGGVSLILIAGTAAAIYLPPLLTW